nr:50S ribosomal protein L4 [Candidatus Levybacteria bacterium]
MPVKKLKTQNLKLKTTAQKSKVAKAVVKKEVKELPKETPARKASLSVAGGGLKLSVYDTKGKVAESITLPKEIFGIEINTNLMSQAVRVYLANQRRGTVKTKTRGEVKISTRKIYRQKGTGRARHGAASAPIFVGGGVAFGPRQRDYSLKLSQKMRKVALFSALSSKLKAGDIKIVAGLEKLESKTKNFADTMINLSLNEKKPQILLITPKSGKDFQSIMKGARNLKGVKITSSNLLNTYDILAYRNILFMKDSIEGLKETFLKEK